MLCFLCGKEIGWLRSMVDRQYCCTEHRREARLASAQVLREEDDEQEIWSVSRSKTKQVRSGNHSSQTPLAVFLALGTLLIAVLMLPGSGSAPGVVYPSASLEPPRRDGLFARTTY